MRVISATTVHVVTILALFIALTRPAFAQDASTVTLPWGDWLSAILSEVILIAGTVATLLVTWALRYVPETLKAYITEQHRNAAEQLIEKGIDYAINAVKDFTTGKKLDVNVGSQVVAEALNYIIKHGPEWLITWLGGADAIREKILARLDLADGVAAAEVAAVAEVTTVTSPAA